MPRSRSPDTSHDTLRREFAAIAQGEHRSWARIGHLLDRADQSDYWQGEAKSFTEWLKGRASAFKLKESTLWRYLTAGRYYVQLRETLTGRQIACPPLDELSESVSPENLELLSKLARVAPDGVLQDLAIKVINGNITRAELRTTWQAYRPVLGGRTSRGGGVASPRIDLADRSQFDSMMEATVLTELSAAAPEWAGTIHPEIYELFLHVSPERMSRKLPAVSFDAVAVVRSDRQAPLQIHGIEIKSGILSGDLTRQFEAMAPFCDVVWLATPASSSMDFRISVPEFVGILRVDQRRVIVEKSPGQSSLLGTRLLEMTQGLLLKTMKH